MKLDENPAFTMLTRLKRHIGLTILATVALVAMAAAAPFDQAWTKALDQIQWPWVESVMSRSMFEGERFGANDPVLLMMFGVILVYYLAYRKPESAKWSRWRSQAGFIIVSALVIGVYFVHSLKWVMGRARPDLVIGKGLAFSHWYSFGPFFVTDGVYYGSFPSGHTSQMFILMTLAFVLAGDPLLPKPARLSGWVWGVAAVASSFIMGLTRCMSLSHWLTDILGSILMGWVIMHLLYFHLLRVPDQQRFRARHGKHPDMPNAWEIILCLYWLMGVAGLMMMVTGIRALMMYKPLWLLLLIPAGVAGAWFSWTRSVALLRRLWQAIDRGLRNTLPGNLRARKSNCAAR